MPEIKYILFYFRKTYDHQNPSPNLIPNILPIQNLKLNIIIIVYEHSLRLNIYYFIFKKPQN